jgi:hypothetical protein
MKSIASSPLRQLVSEFKDVVMPDGAAFGVLRVGIIYCPSTAF